MKIKTNELAKFPHGKAVATVRVPLEPTIHDLRHAQQAASGLAEELAQMIEQRELEESATTD